MWMNSLNWQVIWYYEYSNFLVVMKEQEGKIVQRVSRDPRRLFWKCFSLPLLLTKKREKMKMKIVIVGGCIGGATAATRIRRLDGHAENCI